MPLEERNGRFSARISVPVALREGIGKSELVTSLAGDRRAAMRVLPEVVAAFQRLLDIARPRNLASKAPKGGRRYLRMERMAIVGLLQET